MIIAPGFIGIDVSKTHLDIFDATVGRPLRVANTAASLGGLIDDWLRRATLVLFEATGCYDLTLRKMLATAGIRFARVNPGRARDFARADAVREELKAGGWIIEDTPKGPRLKRI